MRISARRRINSVIPFVSALTSKGIESMTIQVWDVSSGTAYTRVAPSNTMLSNVSATDLGAAGGGVDQIPNATPATWFIRITQDAGATWSWVTLASLGLGQSTGTLAMFNPTKLSWVDPTLNTDGTPIAGTVGEVITGYVVGIRPASGVAGTYPILMPAVGPTAISELFSALPTVLAPAGTASVNGYYTAVKTTSTFNGVETDSAWSVEVGFSVMIVAKVPTAPTSFTLA
jgi:hypothetical protein